MIKVKIGSDIDAILLKNPNIILTLPIGTCWEIEHWRGGRLLSSVREHNVCTDEGLNSLLDVGFHGTSAIGTWYVTLFETDYTPLVTNTYATPGYTETTAYTESTRPEFVEAAASSKSITNSANKAQFTINDTKIIYGGSLVGGGTLASTKGDTTGGGVLFCSSKFSAAKSCVATDVLLIGVTITLADS